MSAQGRRLPAEWERHAACWTAWPTHRHAWGERLGAAQRQAAAFMRAVAAQPGGERLRVLRSHVDGDAMAQGAADVACDAIDDIPYGDVWLRDTGPVFVHGGADADAVVFGFDGWGGKYRYEHDEAVGEAVARRAGAAIEREPFVLEGGAIECDGDGTLLTTRSCLLDPVRNPGVQQAQVEKMLARRLGARRVLWLGRGLSGDHTDGHVDNLARFVGRRRVLCARPGGASDPNADVLGDIETQLREARDADDEPLSVQTLPSVGLVADAEGAPMAASYLNFYVGNAAVIVPAFGRPSDATAAGVIAGCFPDRRVVSLPADALLTGGGTFHCISRQQPAHLPHG